MSRLKDEVVDELVKQGYIGEHVSFKPSFHTVIDSLNKELLDKVNILADTQQNNSPYYFLTLELHHRPAKMDLSIDFSFQLAEHSEKLQCRRLSATSGEVTRVYKINYDHPIPPLHDVVQTLQQKMQMTPFIRKLDTMLDNMKDHYYNRITSSESNVSIIDAIRRKVNAYHNYNDTGKTRLLKVPGKYHLLRNRMNTTIVVALNKGKEICQIKQIENYQENTKMIFLPGKKQHLDTPFEMLSLLTEKQEIERKMQITKRFEPLPPSIAKRFSRRK